METHEKKGSVLMEFIIVLPLYMILLGMTFLYGELSLHGVNLAASADRTLAGVFGGQEWDGWNGYTSDMGAKDVAKAISPSQDLTYDALNYIEEGTIQKPSSYSKLRGGEVARRSFNGSWSWLVAATMADKYAMTPWTRGMVGTWAHLERLVDMSQPPSAVDGNSVLGTLFGSGGKRVVMTGKDGVSIGNSSSGAMTYSYYTLTRNSKGRIVDSSGTSYRHWDPGSLVDAAYGSATWNTCVYGEGWPMEKVNYASLGSEEDGKGNDPISGTDRPPYERYGQFVTWSE